MILLKRIDTSRVMNANVSTPVTLLSLDTVGIFIRTNFDIRIHRLDRARPGFDLVAFWFRILVSLLLSATRFKVKHARKRSIAILFSFCHDRTCYPFASWRSLSRFFEFVNQICLFATTTTACALAFLFVVRSAAVFGPTLGDSLVGQSNANHRAGSARLRSVIRAARHHDSTIRAYIRRPFPHHFSCLRPSIVHFLLRF